jgi:hypothetical protein
MVDRETLAPQMRHDSGNLRRLKQIPAKACPGLDPGLRDFTDKDLLQHFEFRYFAASLPVPPGRY